jgi:hypothetical protein
MTGPAQAHAHEPWNKPCDETCPGHKVPVVVVCPHHHKMVTGEAASPAAAEATVTTHDWPPMCRQVCPGSGKTAAVVTLPRRVARVAHALIARTRDNAGGPITTTEVCEYDSPVDARTVAHTRRALRRAMEPYGLADRAGWNLWMPTNQAYNLRRALEELALAQETEEGAL